jgi:hypothetical protein
VLFGAGLNWELSIGELITIEGEPTIFPVFLEVSNLYSIFSALIISFVPVDRAVIKVF